MERREVAYRYKSQWYYIAMDVDDKSAITVGDPHIKEPGSIDMANKPDSGPKEKSKCKKCGRNKATETNEAKIDQEPQSQARGFGDFVKGAVGLAKSELGIGHADDETIAERRRICKSCEHQDLGVCDECGCYCTAKVRLSKETCPIGEW